MSYEPTNWKAGDTVTSAKLNKIEQGITEASGCGILIVHITKEGQLDKTWQEIYDADACYISIEESNLVEKLIVTSIFISNEEYKLEALMVHPSAQDIQRIRFTASSPNDYPQVEQLEYSGGGR